MSFYSDIQSLTPGAYVSLYVIDATGIGGSIVRLHPGTNELRQPVVWQGETYQPFPIEVTGLEYNGQGQLPRPTLRVANVTGLLGALVREYQDLRGAKFIIKRTMVKYLDAVNFANGNPEANPAEHRPDEIFIFDRKANENKVMIEFELAASFDLAGVKVPVRVVTQNVCPWQYRVMSESSACSYNGLNYFDANDEPVVDAEDDRCSKRLSGCEARHPGIRLPFGGFPGVGLTR